MTDTTGAAGEKADETDQRSKSEIEADLAQTREHLAETVDALGHRLDVKSRSREKAIEVKDEHGRELAIGGAVVLALVLVLTIRKVRRR